MLKELVNNIYKEFIYSGHFMSLGISIVVWAGCLLLNYSPSVLSLLSIYFLIQPIYWVDRIYGLKEDFIGNKERVEYIQGNIRNLKIIIFIYLLFYTLITFSFSSHMLPYGFLLLLLGLGYGRYFKKVTKYIVGFKNFYVSIFFAIMYIYIMFFHNIQRLDFIVVFFVIFVFLRALLVQIFIDLKDLDVDKSHGLKTFAVIFGRSKVLNIVHFLNVLSVLPIAYLLFLGYVDIYFGLVIVFLVLRSATYIYKAKNDVSYKIYIMLSFDFLFLGGYVLLNKLLL